MKRFFAVSALSLALSVPQVFAGEVAEPVAEPTAEAVAAPQESGWKEVLLIIIFNNHPHPFV